MVFGGVKVKVKVKNYGIVLCVLENRIGGAEKGGAPASLQENNVLSPPAHY
jgi:hypothetical protein